MFRKKRLLLDLIEIFTILSGCMVVNFNELFSLYESKELRGQPHTLPKPMVRTTLQQVFFDIMLAISWEIPSS